ncbi:MAG TPA: hypothetical protein VIZ32_10410, partial [Vicinamibacterales bacterium]
MRLLAFILGLATLASASSAIQAQTAPESTNTPAALPYEASVAAEYSRARLAQDIKAVETYRPEYQFWQYIFTIPDGRIAFGSAHDGRLIATFPAAGDWTRDAVWEEQGLSGFLNGRTLPKQLNERRDEVARLLEPVTGPLVHNPTRGLFLIPNAQRYGSFL